MPLVGASMSGDVREGFSQWHLVSPAFHQDPDALPPDFALDRKDLSTADERLRRMLAKDPNLGKLDVLDAMRKLRVTVRAADGHTTVIAHALAWGSLALWPDKRFPANVELELQEQSQSGVELVKKEMELHPPQLAARGEEL